MKCIIATALLATGCFGEKSVKTQESECKLDANYEVQQVGFDHEKDEYQLHLLNTPTCFKNPLTTSKLELKRIDEGRMFLAIAGDKFTLSMRETDKIHVQSSKAIGNSSSESPSSFAWSPFLMGAAAGALGSRMLQRPPAIPPQQHQASRPIQADQSMPKALQSAAKTDTKTNNIQKETAKPPMAKAAQANHLRKKKLTRRTQPRRHTSRRSFGRRR
ncbi:MAG: hypothetical protein AB8C84_10075 [Oligoflexales bacterium]